MIDESKILELITERDEVGLDDVKASEIRAEIIKELGTDEAEIVKFLDALEDENLYMISEVFQGIAEVLQSETFTSRLEEIQSNHPDIDIMADISATNLLNDPPKMVHRSTIISSREHQELIADRRKGEAWRT